MNTAAIPDSIAFCREAGLDYVSCSPPRVKVARLAAAQAELKSEARRRLVGGRVGAEVDPMALDRLHQRADPIT